MGIAKWIVIILYYCCINGYAYWLMKEDKQLAKRHKHRISEKRFFWLCFLGGAVGIWLAMKVFRHKTKHASFIVGVPTLLILHIGAIYAAVHLYEYYY